MNVYEPIRNTPSFPDETSRNVETRTCSAPVPPCWFLRGASMLGWTCAIENARDSTDLNRSQRLSCSYFFHIFYIFIAIDWSRRHTLLNAKWKWLCKISASEIVWVCWSRCRTWTFQASLCQCWVCGPSFAEPFAAKPRPQPVSMHRKASQSTKKMMKHMKHMKQWHIMIT